MTNQLSDLIHVLNTAKRPSDRADAANKLGHVGGPVATKALAEAMPNNNDKNDPKGVARKAIIKALIKIDSIEARLSLQAGLKNDDLYALVAKGLGESGTRWAMDVLFGALGRESSESLRKAAIVALGATESKHFPEALEYARKNGDMTTRASIEYVLIRQDKRKQ